MYAKQFADLATKETRDHYVARKDAMKAKDRRRKNPSLASLDRVCVCKACLATQRNSGRYNYARKVEAFPDWKDRTVDDADDYDGEAGRPCDICKWSNVLGACEWSGLACESCRRYRETATSVPSTRRQEVTMADLLATARPMKRPRRHGFEVVQTRQVVAVEEEDDDDWMSAGLSEETDWEWLKDEP